MSERHHYLPYHDALKLLLFLSATVIFTSCRGNEWEPCPPTGCASDLSCLSPGDVCVLKCTSDKNCPKGETCTGWFRDAESFSSRGGRFCKPASRNLGGSCEAPRSGCKPGLQCIDDRCSKMCMTDGDCPADWRCSLSVLVPGRPDLSPMACARATRGPGDKCGPDMQCRRGLECIEGICRQLCTSSRDCPKGQKCRGRGYSGWRGRLRFIRRGSADFHFCTP